MERGRWLVIIPIVSVILSVAIVCMGDARIDEKTNVLFLGNSYTAGNNLPQIFTDLAASGDKEVETDMNTPGGCTLFQHSQSTTSLDMIAEGGWDFVVLQEQSQYPTIDYYRETYMYPGARVLDQHIQAVCAETLLFMTWGREYGGKQVINGHASPPFVDFYAMQNALRIAYYGIALELTARVAPVGMAWQTAMTLNHSVDLWADDHSHPTYQGSYLAACVLYAVIFNETPEGLAFTGSLSAEQAAFLQYAAARTVFAKTHVHR
ncbi:hypothetical protein JXA80_06245 [bacterium]|nr:hypothetical protein [candidate division CSSED10-310 bacterium]